jgi:succinylglutamate desuccinylase
MSTPAFETTDAPGGRASSDRARTIGTFRGDARGPTLIVTGGLHGNEPAGVHAAERIAGRMHEMGRTLRGQLVLLRGNRGALAEGRRFVRRDLNRGWTEERISSLLRGEREDFGDEDLEQRELAEIFDAFEREAGEIAFLDLHSTSGASAPFVCFGDTLANRHFARHLPVTAVLGLEEVIDGAMLGLMSDRGHRAIAVEGGQHGDPGTIDRHEAAIWICLVALGLLTRSEVPGFDDRAAALEQASRNLPSIVEVRHRHVVGPNDDFEMLPGFASFAPIARGQRVARDCTGDVLSPEGGLMLMPRYQGQGEDGYFVAREVAPFWLGVSEWLRRARAHRLLPYLPGVARHPAHGSTLIVDPRVARTRVADIMHLCGYRKRRPEGGRLLFSRRTSEG